MGLEMDTSLPSTRFLQSYVKDNTPLEVQTMTGDRVTGRMAWQDPVYFCLIDDREQQYFLSRQHVVCIKPMNTAS